MSKTMIQRPRILIVEPDLGLRSQVVTALRRYFLVTIADDGMQGYALALQYHPDVIITEFHMQGWSGVQLLGQIRKHRLLARVPIIILTADSSRATFGEALAAGANDYLIKSHFTREVLIEKVQRAVNARAEVATS